MSAVSIYGVKFKKDLKTKVGESIDKLSIDDPSMFGPSIPESGNGDFQVVGPGLYQRNWFANVTIENRTIVKVT